MPKEIIIAVAALIIILLILIIKNVYKIIIRRNLTAEMTLFQGKTSKKRTFLLLLYRKLSSFIVTKRYIKRVTEKYEILCNVNQKEIQLKSIKFVLTFWSISLLALIVFFIRRPSFYSAALSVFLIWYINREMTFSSVRKAALKLLKQLYEFLSDIRYYYYVNGSVEDAIEKSIELCGKEMKTHAQKIYEFLLLGTEERQDQISKYNESTRNDHLKMFMAECIAVVDYGDKVIDKQSVFLTNILDMKNNIHDEIRDRELIVSLFRFLNAIIISPLLVLDITREWVLSIIPELYEFYYGQRGLLLLAVIFILTSTLYTMLGYMKENRPVKVKNYDYLENLSKVKPIQKALDNYIKKNYGKMEVLRNMFKRMGENITPKQFLVKRILFAVGATIFSTGMFISLHIIDQHNIITQVNNADKLTNTIDPRQTEAINQTIKVYVGKLVHQKKVSKEAIEKELDNAGIIRSDSAVTVVADEIINRLNRYKNEYLKFYEVIISFLIGYISYFYPYWMILYRKKLLENNMNNEVMQFQAIILMLMHLDRMTVVKILEYMELFAVIFKDSIRACINEFDKGDIEALEKLKETEKYLPFQRLVESFLISDAIGVEKAFDQVAVERNNLREKRKQDNEIKINDQGAVANFIVYIHIFLVTIIYLVIPFMYVSMNKLGTYNTEIAKPF